MIRALSYVMQGLNRFEISEKLFLSFHTVNTHLGNIYTKMDVHSTRELILKKFSMSKEQPMLFEDAVF
jgi:DNA-binding CsgD family transcriptional regulator